MISGGSIRPCRDSKQGLEAIACTFSEVHSGGLQWQEVCEIGVQEADLKTPERCG